MNKTIQHDETILERLRKIKRLADAGVGGERENAARMLHAHLEKLGLSLDDLSDTEMSVTWFSCSNSGERQLVIQICSKILGSHEFKKRETYGTRLRRNVVGIELREWEAAEAEYLYVSYRRAFKAAVKKQVEEARSIAARAFFHANSLLGACSDNDDKPTRKEIEMAIKAARMASDMNKVVIPRRALPV